VSGWWLELEQLFDRIDHPNRPTAPAQSKHQAETDVVVDDIEEIEDSIIDGLIQMKVYRLDVDGNPGLQQLRLSPEDLEQLRRHERSL